jgi:hypothetical protein
MAFIGSCVPEMDFSTLQEALIGFGSFDDWKDVRLML